MNRRLVIAAVVVVALVAVGIVASLEGWITPASVRDWLDEHETAGPALFALVFVVGSLVGIPGMVMVVAGRLAFGPVLGFALGYSCGVGACLMPFLTARLFGWESAWQPKHRYAMRAFELVDTHPVRAVAALRLVLWFNAPLSYSLALTRIELRTYATGCAIALAPVVGIAVVATSWFV